MSTTTEFYKAAIDRLEDYLAVELDAPKRQAASQKITQLRLAIQKANFDDMSQRTARLTQLRTDLEGIIASAGSGAGIGSAIAQLRNLAEEVGQAIGV